jgi:hypothetical protein
MSKRNNVNPDHYKVGGREHIGNAAAKNPQQLHAVNRGVERAPDRIHKKKIRQKER